MIGEACSVETVRALEAAAIERLGDDDILMQRAAAGLAAAVAGSWPSCAAGVYGTKVLVMVGPGNNGGDALFAGARLARRGVSVTAVRCLGEPHARGLAALRAAGGRMVDLADLGIRAEPVEAPSTSSGCNRGSTSTWPSTECWASAVAPGCPSRSPIWPAPSGLGADPDRGRRPALGGGRGHRSGAGRGDRGPTHRELRGAEVLPPAGTGPEPVRRDRGRRHRPAAVHAARQADPAVAAAGGRGRAGQLLALPGRPAATSTPAAVVGRARRLRPSTPGRACWPPPVRCTREPEWSASWARTSRRPDPGPAAQRGLLARSGAGAPARLRLGRAGRRPGRDRRRAGLRLPTVVDADGLTFLPERCPATGCSPRTPASWPSCSARNGPGSPRTRSGGPRPE
jgi:hypothetical protein